MRTLIVMWMLVSVALAGQDRPLPNSEALLAAARENLSRAERDDHLYAFKERRTDLHTNPFGRLGTGGTRVLDVYPSATRQLTYRRIIERDGTLVLAQELAQQDREYRARVTDVLKRQGERSADERRTREDAARQRTLNRVDDVVEALEFTVQGRAMLDSTPAILVTFVGRPQAKPTTREGRIAQKFEGKVWIDEAAAEVIRVEAIATDDISFGLGLVARLGKGTTALLVRRPVEGGIWMPTELKLSGRGRAAIFRRLVVDFAVQWFDYRRLSGTSLTPFLDAGVQGQSGSRPQ